MDRLLGKISAKYRDDKNPSLGPIFYYIKITGLWPSERSVLSSIVFYVSFLFSVIYFTSTVLFLIFKFRYDAFLLFVQHCSLPMGIYKAYNLLKYHKTWKSIVEAISRMETISQPSGKHVKVLLQYKKYSHMIIASFVISCTMLPTLYLSSFWGLSVILPDVQGKEGKNLFLAYLPLDENLRLHRYISAFLQTMFFLVTLIYVLCWDSLVLGAMVFFCGQFKALKVRCAHALDNHLEDTCLDNIMSCCEQYVQVIRCQRMFNSAMSPIMFTYLILVTANYGVCITLIALSDGEMDISEKVPALLAAVGITTQLLMFYWVGNYFIVYSLELSDGTYDSLWLEKNVKLRRAMLMLGMGMRQRVAFTAGPFNEMSLETFINILRKSYSFYTLLSRHK